MFTPCFAVWALQSMYQSPQPIDNSIPAVKAVLCMKLSVRPLLEVVLVIVTIIITITSTAKVQIFSVCCYFIIILLLFAFSM